VAGGNRARGGGCCGFGGFGDDLIFGEGKTLLNGLVKAFCNVDEALKIF